MYEIILKHFDLSKKNSRKVKKIKQKRENHEKRKNEKPYEIRKNEKISQEN